MNHWWGVKLGKEDGVITSVPITPKVVLVRKIRDLYSVLG